MRRVDAKSAEVLVFTFKEGLLSAVAHNLKIRVTKFVIEVDETTRAIRARFDPTSLRVVCAIEGGVDAPDSLSAANRREIEGNIVRDVLDSGRYREITFVSSAVESKGPRHTVKGTLTLHGVERRLSIKVREADGSYQAEINLHQPDFGITPYRALLGAIRVKAVVTVRVTIPVPTTRKLAHAADRRTGSD